MQRGRTARALAALGIALGTLVSGAVVVPAAAAANDITFFGHGYGHGRGLSQYGSYGYAVDQGWDYRQILDRYYGGTTLGTVNNDDITVELLSNRGTSPAIIGGSLAVNGVQTGTAALRIRREAAGSFAVDVATGCAGPWTPWQGGLGSGLTIATADAPTAANLPKVCEAGQTRGYRGALQVFEGAGYLALVNRLPVEQYLLGVVPRESPASWGAAGGGRGLNALRAQSVAARSYALAGGWTGYAQTCDTTSCQVYQGSFTQAPSGAYASLENPYTDQAVSDTAGQVRRTSGGAVARTEFSSSSGGWTAGGTFPAVEDLGDATAGNPNYNWTAAFSASDVAAKLGVGPITGMTVTQRNGLGRDGGRVQQVVVTTTSGQAVFTGATFRSKLGLKSDWFTISFNAVNPAQSTSYVRGLYNDVLLRPNPSDGEVSAWANAVSAGTSRALVATAFTQSTERMYRLIDGVYSGALRRSTDAAGYRTWGAYLANGATLNDLNAAIYGSPESFQVLGGGDNGAWVDGMYQGLLGRAAGAGERSYWTQVAAVQGRGQVAWLISASYEARQRRLNQYYLDLLQRPVDNAGMASWMPYMEQRGDFIVPTFIVSSQEYWQTAPSRFP